MKQNRMTIRQWLFDPVSYRRRARALLRRFTAIPDRKIVEDWRELGPLEKALVVIAHPDDETFCSGLILSLVRAGVTVELICLTRGEGGPTGGQSRESLGSRREAEMRKACDVLGISSVRFLDLVDPVAKRLRMYAPRISAADLAAVLQEPVRRADLVLSHGSSGEYWHPGHVLVFDALMRIRNGRGFRGHWLTFLARQAEHPLPRFVNWDDPAFLRFDAEAVSELRRQALECHQSQRSLFCRFGGGDLSDFIAKTAVEAYALQSG